VVRNKYKKFLLVSETEPGGPSCEETNVNPLTVKDTAVVS